MSRIRSLRRDGPPPASANVVWVKRADLTVKQRIAIRDAMARDEWPDGWSGLDSTGALWSTVPRAFAEEHGVEPVFDVPPEVDR